MKPGIFYLYEYDNTKKLRNAGFLKITRYYHSCTLQLNARGIPVSYADTIKLCAFYPENDLPTSAVLAEITCANHALSARLNSAESRFPAGQTLDTISGFFLPLSNGHILAAAAPGIAVDAAKLLSGSHKSRPESPSGPIQQEIREEPLPTAGQTENREAAPSISEQMENREAAPSSAEQTENRETAPSSAGQTAPCPELEAESVRECNTDGAWNPAAEQRNREAEGTVILPENEGTESIPPSNIVPSESSRTESTEISSMVPSENSPMESTALSGSVPSQSSTENSAQCDPVPSNNGSPGNHPEQEYKPGPGGSGEGKTPSGSDAPQGQDTHNRQNQSADCDSHPRQDVSTEQNSLPEQNRSAKQNRSAEQNKPAEQDCPPEQNSQNTSQNQDSTAGQNFPAQSVKKIRRSEMSCLPRRYWHLANNSFLLHGYHNYNHLLLIEKDGHYWLGVPGIYDPHEARAARLFGFPQFTDSYNDSLQLSDDECNPNENFGYWCCFLK